MIFARPSSHTCIIPHRADPGSVSSTSSTATTTPEDEEDNPGSTASSSSKPNSWPHRLLKSASGVLGHRSGHEDADRQCVDFSSQRGHEAEADEGEDSTDCYENFGGAADETSASTSVSTSHLINNQLYSILIALSLMMILLHATTVG